MLARMKKDKNQYPGTTSESLPFDLNEDDLLALPLKGLMEKITATPPEITGGCVLLMNAVLTSSMIVMALKLSLRKVKDPLVRRILRHRIKEMNQFQVGFMEAASDDLAAFNEYRAALRSRSRTKAMKVEGALRRATDSLTAANALLQKAIAEARAAGTDVTDRMMCDLEAGILGLEAIFSGLQILVASNEQQLKH